MKKKTEKGHQAFASMTDEVKTIYDNKKEMGIEEPSDTTNNISWFFADMTDHHKEATPTKQEKKQQKTFCSH